jgi:iron complex outermembrane receptor protein
MNRILVVTFLLLSSSLSTAQTDTTIVIEDINIIESNIRSANLNVNLIELENEFSSGSLAQVIEQNSNSYIKNYGPGSLSTFSIRGGSAGQSLVLWNGLPLHSPMLGLLDLSLIPSNIGNKISLSKGGNSAMWGSGAVSGLLAIEAGRQRDYTLLSTSSIGSFGSLNQSLKINLTKGRWQSTSKYIHESSDRDFEYEVSPLLPKIKQTNASYNRNHFVQDLYFDLNNSNQFEAHIWAYKASTQIPPTTVQSNSVAYQDDSAIRSILAYKHIGRRSILESKIGFFRDYNNFYDSSILLEALNVFDSWFGEINSQFQKGNHKLSIGSTFNYTKATSEGYKGTATENKVGIFATHLLEKKKIKIKSSIRQSFIDGSLVPFIPNLAITFKPFHWAKIHLIASRDFRSPTLNDRFWKPGGNQELSPESGWSEEIGFSLSKKIGGISSEYSTTFFHRDIKNWILWSPGQNVPYWAAQNINNVVSQGIEQTISFRYVRTKLQINLDLNYDYISSAFQTALTIPKVEAGDQLLYNPKHNGRASLSLKVDKWKLKYKHSFTGMTRGVNELLPSFHTGKVEMAYNTKIQKTNLTINMNVFNVLDHRYFIIERRPIAGRNYNIGITIKY